MPEAIEFTCTRKLRLRIEHESGTENPCEWGEWKVHSFGRRHINYTDPNEFFPPSIGFRRKLATGTAFILSYYEHGNCQWSLQGQGQQCPWDSVNVAGVLVWSGKPEDLSKDRTKRREYAAGFLETYTDWCNGNCYWFSLVSIDDDGEETGEVDDSCGGFIGYGKDNGMMEHLNLQAGDVITEVTGDGAWIADDWDLPRIDK